MRKRKKLHEISLDTDIKYVGPLSEREFRILGWICLIFIQISILMRAGVSLNPALATRFSKYEGMVSIISEMALPFLLMANFAAILNNTEKSTEQLFLNLIFSVIFGGLFLLIFYHYGVGFISIFSRDKAVALQSIKNALTDDGGKKYICFNIFVDLLLCSLISFFLFYRSSKPVKKWIHMIFRFAALLPIFYEAGTIYIKYLAHISRIVIPIWAFPLLPVKPPMTFILFVVLALFMKSREVKFCKYGRSYEEYQLFLQTNRNSLHFSIYASITSFLAGLVDLTVFVIFTMSEIYRSGIDYSQVDMFVPVILKLGFGNSTGLIFFAPILMLFSYNRKATNRTVITLIPVFGVLLIIIVYLQGAYQLLHQIPEFIITKLDLSSLLG